MSVDYVLRVASLAEYRESTVRELFRRLGSRVRIEAGDRSPDGTVRVLGGADIPGIVSLRNTYVSGLLFQSGSVAPAIRARVTILDLNPRVPQTWLTLAIRRALRRPTLLWGHAWPRAGSMERPGRSRSLMRSLASGIITYTRTQAKQLSSLDPRVPTFPAPNALYSRVRCSFNPQTNRTDFIYVGRLVPEKKPDLLLEAFSVARDQLVGCRLVLVGSGPMDRVLRRRAEDLRCADNVSFIGHESRFEVLKTLYDRSVASVSPGYAGLSITQSFAFGVPMLISRDEPHAPEIEAAREGANAMFFRTDDVADLARALVEIYSRRVTWAQRGDDIAQACATEYSVEAMAAGIVGALEAF